MKTVWLPILVILFGLCVNYQPKAFVFPLISFLLVLFSTVEDWEEYIRPGFVRASALFMAVCTTTFYFYPEPGRWECEFYPSIFNLPYEHMFTAIFFTWGLLLWKSAWDIRRNIIFYDFHMIQGFLHGVSMLLDSFTRIEHNRHFSGDVVIHLMFAVVYICLRPPHPPLLNYQIEKTSSIDSTSDQPPGKEEKKERKYDRFVTKYSLVFQILEDILFICIFVFDIVVVWVYLR